MAYGRPAHIRSHRRAGSRRRPRRTAPWISVAVVSALVLSGLVVGYQQLLARACSGQVTARVVAAPSIAQPLDRLATAWLATEPSTRDGTCARVLIESRDSAEVAGLLAAGWDKRSGEPPDVWVPVSSAWVQRAAASEAAVALLPDDRPSIARSPTVIAMPEPMAQALGWPEPRLGDEEVRWATLVDVFADDRGWERFDRPEWGPFRLGMTDPARSTAALHALTALLDTDDDGEIADDELAGAFTLRDTIAADVYHDTTEQLLTALEEAAAADETAGLRHVSAFPALEYEVLIHNGRNPVIPLTAVYPVDGAAEADFPYLVLRAEWSGEPEREAAAEFLAFLRGPQAQEELRAAGFRGVDQAAGEGFASDLGVVETLAAPARTVPVPASVTRTIDQWTALTRSTNVLLLLDVSGTMAAEVPGTGQTRLDRIKQAAAETVRLFPDEANVGCWEFSTAIDGDLDYRSLVPLGRIDDVMEDDRRRRDHLLSAIDGLVPRTDTGLYNALAAAYDAVLANYDDESANLVVVVTDGGDDTGGRPGLSLDELLDHLDQAPAPGQQVRVVVLAVSDGADLESLEAISSATGGRLHHVAEDGDLVDALRTAVFGGGSAG